MSTSFKQRYLLIHTMRVFEKLTCDFFSVDFENERER